MKLFLHKELHEFCGKVWKIAKKINWKNQNKIIKLTEKLDVYCTKFSKLRIYILTEILTFLWQENVKFSEKFAKYDGGYKIHEKILLRYIVLI